MRRRSRAARAAAAVLLPAVVSLLWLAVPARAQLFADDDARKAILDLRNRFTQAEEQAKARQADLNEQIQTLRRSLLEMNNQIETQRGEIARLRGSNEQLLRDVAELQKRERDLGQALDDRLRKIEPQKVALDGQEFLADPEEKRQFDDAMAVLRGGEFDKAAQAFASFQKRWPAGGYADAARFWQGNALYGKRDYAQAIAAFRAYLAKAPAGARAPEAMLAIANSQLESKDTKGARKTIEELMRLLPKSEAAAARLERLKTLRRADAPPMPSEAELPALAARLLWAAFGLGLVFGAVARRTHFCTMGAIADIVASGDWTRMRMWVLAIATAMIGFNAMVAAGWVQAGDSLYATPRLAWLAHVLGGLLFGFGMVLASGCPNRTLVRAGGGNLKALVVLLVLGVSAAVTMRGLVAVLRVASVERAALQLPATQDLPSLLALAGGWPRSALALLLGLGIGALLLAWVLARPEGRSRAVWQGGLGIGAAVVALWWLSGVAGHLAEHPATLEPAFIATDSRRMESFSFVAPAAYALDWLMLFSDASRTLSLGVAGSAGVLLGAAAVALADGSFRWEGFGGAEDTANHLAGAALMGVGGVTALGCTIGQGISGLSTLALGSFIAVAAIVAGAWLGLRWQLWRIERNG